MSKSTSFTQVAEIGQCSPLCHEIGVQRRRHKTARMHFDTPILALIDHASSILWGV